MHNKTIAIVGATGAVGQTMLEILAERRVPAANLVALASERSAGSFVDYGEDELLVHDLAGFDPAGVDIALFSAGGDTARRYAPTFAQAGAVVIDNSSAFRHDDDVPLVVSEVNPEAVAKRPRGIIANPNCSTMQLVVALAPIHRAAGIERVNVTTYQSVSGAGGSGLEELGRQTAALLSFQDAEPQTFPVQIAFNLIPQIDAFLDNGYTREEMKVVRETRKILGDDAIRVSATAVRVPVFYGHSEAVSIETREPITADAVRALLRAAPGIEVVDDPAAEEVAKRWPTPVTHASGKDPVYVGRIRQDLSHERGIVLWVVADNIRKGAALNAVQLAELVAAEGRARIES
ncbi:MAG: aspartate-semialdehyde dehydrogenase [Pseudoxanthomonas suwonensis]|nr:aspartate-semialdehyde dehydrogenase [Pseudoxanthomonas suwonensis]